MFWLVVSLVAAAVYFQPGIGELLEAWQRPEYSHGPLIPILSGFMFLRQLKETPISTEPVTDRWVGILIVAISIAFAALGIASKIYDLVAYALILWTGGIVILGFGWKEGRQYWPPVLHLVFMLPLPAVLYYKVSTYLQFVSSELGVWLLQIMSVPVFLDGNIIDLGVYKLHVAEACSGLRYLFPIMSFSYIFAVLYKGPTWHKAVLLLSAAPITVLMNSVRIAIAGYIVNNFGLGWVEGFTHFFEGWVIFVSCVILLFILARILLFFNDRNMSLPEALDLDVDGLGPQALRLGNLAPSRALIASALMLCAAAMVETSLPDNDGFAVERETFTTFPRRMGEWRQSGLPDTLDEATVAVLGASDYHSVTFVSDDATSPVGFFATFYEDQSTEGVHSPEVCLPAGGWEIAWLERTDLSSQLGTAEPFNVNRAIIQKGEARMMVYYWFEQQGRHVAWDIAAKMYLMIDGIRSGRTDGGLVRLTTPILPSETDEDAEARLQEMTVNVLGDINRFIPD